VANHRAEKPAKRRRPDAPNPGHRRADATQPVASRRLEVGKRHAGTRKRLIPGLPSAPSLVGAAALVLAAGGAITISTTGIQSELASGDLYKVGTQASVLNGATSIGTSNALKSRQRAVSRDSQRLAQQDAADQKLQSAVEQQAKAHNAALGSLTTDAQKQATIIAKNAWQLPVQAGVYHLTARFGDCYGLWSRCHTGLDFAAPYGTPIHAVANGVITETGWDGSYGYRTIETLADGTELWYAHQSAIEVSVGDKVVGGQQIGTIGTTGNTTGPHVHLEVHPGGGDPVDPYAALVAHGVTP
jgi:murein DD-endopeptidase MepM/ murein hydrolase activator NlpD